MTEQICALTSPFPATAAMPHKAAEPSGVPDTAPREEIARPDAAASAALPAPCDEAPRHARNNGVWRVVEEAVVGLAHRAQNLPCQDAARAVHRPRPVVVVADGAGSSAVSELGAQAVVTGTIRLLDSLDKPLAELLDSPAAPAPALARSWGLLLVKHAMGLLKDLGAQHRREVRDFRCTFLLMVAGTERLLWLKVGDGALVIERMRLQTAGSAGQAAPWEPELSSLGEAGKGEFANQTVFLDAATPDDVQLGWLPAADITGLAAMSDGAAERLVSSDGSRVAPRIASLLQQLREDRLRRQALTQMFYEEGFCKGSSGDDRSIALAACGVQAPPAAEPRRADNAGTSPPQSAPARVPDSVTTKPASAPPGQVGALSPAIPSAPGRPTLFLKKSGHQGKKSRR